MSDGFTKEERAAMKERTKELKAEERLSKSREDGEKDLLEKIGQMPEAEREIAMKIHEIVKSVAPELLPKTWYGMPAYAASNGKIVCFFQCASKFGVRYSTLGFQEQANLDEGAMWPNAYALTVVTPEEEKRIAALVKRAIS